MLVPSLSRYLVCDLAAAAAGLRSVRYFKEVPGVRTIVANDLDPKAVESIARNVTFNGIATGEGGVLPNQVRTIDTQTHKHASLCLLDVHCSSGCVLFLFSYRSAFVAGRCVQCNVFAASDPRCAL